MKTYFLWKETTRKILIKTRDEWIKQDKNISENL